METWCGFFFEKSYQATKFPCMRTKSEVGWNSHQEFKRFMTTKSVQMHSSGTLLNFDFQKMYWSNCILGQFELCSFLWPLRFGFFWWPLASKSNGETISCKCLLSLPFSRPSVVVRIFLEHRWGHDWGRWSGDHAIKIHEGIEKKNRKKSS